MEAREAALSVINNEEGAGFKKKKKKKSTVLLWATHFIFFPAIVVTLNDNL